MIRSLLRAHAIGLRRDRPAQILTFVVPIVFFTIFALVFGGTRSGTRRVRIAAVDESRTTASARFLRALQAEKGLVVTTRAPAGGPGRATTQVPLTAARAAELVRDGTVPLAVVLPAGIDTSLGRMDGGGVPVRLLSDPSDAIAPQLVAGLLQKVAMTAAPDLFLERGVGQFERFGGGLTARQRQAVDQWLPQLRARADRGAGTADTADAAMSGMVRIVNQPVLGRKEDTSLVSFYAAAIAVMFLLFMASAVAGTLLDEVDSGTLERVLSTRVGMTGLLAGKWVWLTLLGMLQIAVMFVYAMLVFRLDLFGHLAGFLVMTLFTAATAAAFGLFLAPLCRTRAQLGGISLLLILVMSAVGGSMFPRFLMPAGMQKAGLVTFNAWALDGYIKVFWREAPLGALLPQLSVLAAFLVVFLAVARLLARRWERA